MSVDVQWDEIDPATGEKRFVCVDRFARKWRFRTRARRRENWATVARPTRAMWVELLDALERRLPRREGVTEVDVVAVRQLVAKLPPPDPDPTD